MLKNSLLYFRESDMASSADFHDEHFSAEDSGASSDEGPHWNSDEDLNEAPGDALGAYLLELKYKSVLSAKQCCVLAWWAVKGGATGDITEKLAFRPTAPSGHYNRKFKSATGAHAHDHRNYVFSTPGYVKTSATRESINLTICPPHESLSEEVDHDPDILSKASDRQRKHLFPPRYDSHPVVTGAPENTIVVPYALYLDGLPYNKVDSLLAIYAYTTISERRHLVASIRKKDICKCGCHGYCTLFQVFSVLRWSMSAAASGQFPSCRHNGEVFSSTDSVRSRRSGEDMKCRFALMYLKGDWAEYCTTLGLTSWSANHHCCPWCQTSQETFFDTAGFSFNSFPHALKSDDTYEAACAVCEIRCAFVSQADLDSVRAELFFDPLGQTHQGRALGKRFPHLGLKIGDRVEPCAELPDVAMLDSLRAPCTVLFWRPANEVGVKRRCPLFNPSIGIGIQSLVCDVMHCMYLGNLQRWVSFVWWKLCLGNAWQVPASGEKEMVHLSIGLLRAEYHRWIKRYRKNHPEEAKSITEVPNISRKILGEQGKYELKTKAMMTRSLVPFSIYLLNKFPRVIEHQSAIRAAGESLERLIVLCRVDGAQVRISTFQDRVVMVVVVVA